MRIAARAEPHGLYPAQCDLRRDGCRESLTATRRGEAAPGPAVGIVVGGR
jgi:hypothetical protein